MNPEDVVTFELGAGVSKDFYVNASELTISIKGAYSVSGGEKNKIHMKLLSPRDEILKVQQETKEAVFEITPDMLGLYKIRFSNKNVNLMQT